MNTDLVVNQEFIEPIKDNKLTLNQFPLKLRRIAIAYIEAQGKKSLKELSQELNVSYESVVKAIQRSKKKGRNIWELMNGLTFEMLTNNVHSVDVKTLKEGLEGTHKDRELFYRRVGLLKETVQHEHKHIHLHHSAPLPVIMPIVDLDED